MKINNLNLKLKKGTFFLKKKDLKIEDLYGHVIYDIDVKSLKIYEELKNETTSPWHEGHSFHIHKEFIVTEEYNLENVCYFINNLMNVDRISSKYYKDSIILDTIVNNVNREINNLERTIEDYKSRLIVDIESKMRNEKLLRSLNREKLDFKLNENFKIVSPKILSVTYTNITAEDTEGDGDDIFLGDLTFEIHLASNSVYLMNGTEPRSGYDDNYVYHPHQLKEDGEICLGTKYADVTESIQVFNFSVLYALLYQFATSYTSTDSAGEYWKAWTEDGYGIEVYGRRGRYRSDEVRFSEYHNEYLHYDDVVYIENFGDYVHEDEATYSDYLSEYILLRDAVETEDGEWVWREDEDLITVDGKYYLKKSSSIVYSNNIRDWVLLEDVIYVENKDDYYWAEETVYSVEEGQSVLKEEAVEIDGQWYLKNSESVKLNEEKDEYELIEN